jgi:sulfate transport system permease protein
MKADPAWLRALLSAAAIAVLLLLVVVPVASVFVQALSGGVSRYVERLFGDPETRHSMVLTATVVPIALAANVVFGLAFAWVVSRFSFRGRSVLTALVDLPFTVSPVVAGLMFVLLFGRHAPLGAFLLKHDVHVLFATPGLVLATCFVTFPFVARELVPLLTAIGPDEELAAVSLGASGWQMFRHVTLPNVKWGLLYGVVLCGARAMGEFGAVYVVSGHVSGRTDTMPLRIERLFQDYDLPGAFALASVLTLVALGSLAAKSYLEAKRP